MGVFLFFLAACCCWQAVLLGRLRSSCIFPNKVRIWSSSAMVFLHDTRRSSSALFVKLPWPGKEMGGAVGTGSLNKCSFLLSATIWWSVYLPLFLAGRGGEEVEGIEAAVCGSGGEWGRVVAAGSSPCAKHKASSFGAVIFGRNGGPTTTSIAEALSGVNRWSSTLLLLQVVCLRRSCGGWRFWLFVGNEILGIFLDLGVCASRSPASGDGGLLAVDCFGYFYARVLFVKVKALSLISRLVWAIDVKGLFCNSIPADNKCSF
jgi:hypothetical protein